MIMGCVEIITKVTQAYEYGIYRVTEDGRAYLMVSYNKENQAIDKGFKIAGVLDVPFKNKIYQEPKKLKGIEKDGSEKPKRVKGVIGMCVEHLKQQKSETEIKQIIEKVYTDAGHTNAKAKELTYSALYDAKRKFNVL